MEDRKKILESINAMYPDPEHYKSLEDSIRQQGLTATLEDWLRFEGIHGYAYKILEVVEILEVVKKAEELK